MLFLISPAKTLDYDTPVPAALRRKATEPLFTAQAAELVEVLRHKTPAQVASLMDLSEMCIRDRPGAAPRPGTARCRRR